MNKFLLALLMAKFAGVRQDGLAQMAKSLALTATTDEEAKALVEKLTDAQVNDYVKEYRSEVDRAVSEGKKTYEETLKKKYDFTEKKAPEDKNPADLKPTDDLAAQMKAMLAETLAPLQQELASLKGAKQNESRLQGLSSKLNECKDEVFKAKVLKDFGRMNFETEEAFNEYLTETEADIATANQAKADAGLQGHQRPFTGQVNKDGVSTAVDSYIKSKAPESNNLAGKEL